MRSEGKIRILHFVSVPAKYNGIMSVLMNYYRHLDREHFQFDFLCFIKPASEVSYEKEIASLGGRVSYIKKPGTRYSVSELKSFFTANYGKYQVIQVHEVYLAWLLRPMSRRYGGIRTFIVHSHATQYSDKLVSALRNRFFCLPVRRMNSIHFAACGERAGSFLFGDAGKRRRDVFIMLNAPEPGNYQFNKEHRIREREKYGVRSDEILLGHVGRFAKQKNQLFLLKVLRELGASGKNFRLILIGGGADEKKIRVEVKRQGLDGKVIFAGELDGVSEVLSAMDIFLLPSLYEGLPMVQLEAQANGLPVIASEYVTPEAGVLRTCTFLPLDAKKWAEAVLRASGERNLETRILAPEIMKKAGYDLGFLTRQYENYLRKIVRKDGAKIRR